MKNPNAGMKDKILCWLDNDLLHFGIAKYLKEKHDCDMYTIIDINKHGKKFFQTQEFVKFNKIWYYRDFISKPKEKPDLDYLKYFEEKYGINLWEIAYTEGYFYKYNEYYKFNYNEILSILEQECKLFETILNESKPNFLITKLVDYHQNRLLRDLCKSMGIKILMLSPTRFGYRSTISTILDEVVNLEKTNIDIKNEDKLKINLKNYVNKYNISKQENEAKSRERASFKNYLKASSKFLIFICNKEYRNSYYGNYGRTRLKVLVKEGSLLLKKVFRNSFLNHHCIRDIEKNVKFVYFPLHFEPERALASKMPYYMNQPEVIINIAKSLPIEYKLYVKEHNAMKLMSWRNLSFYKKILELPNVVLVHPSVESDEILKKCSLVITIAGTTGIEAAFHNKPSIVFSDISYSILPFVYRLKNIEDLPHVLRFMLEKKVDFAALNQYVNCVDKNSFEFSLWKPILDISDYFFMGGFLRDAEISNEKMKSFLENNRLKFELLANEHIKRIKENKNFLDG